MNLDDSNKYTHVNRKTNSMYLNWKTKKENGNKKREIEKT